MEQMIVRDLSPEEVRDVYNQRMIFDFSFRERKPLRQIEKMLRRGEYRCFGLLEGPHLAAYAFFQFQKGGIYLLDYLAVDQRQRGRGTGSLFLRMLSNTALKDAKCVLLEVEDPNGAPTDREARKRQRRLQFYLKNGIVDAGIGTRTFWMDYLILRMPLGDNDVEVGEIYKGLYRRILPEALCRLVVHVKRTQK